MLHFEMHNGIFDDGEGVDIAWRDYVRDVAVDEDVAGGETEEGGFGDSRVGAAEPENTWALPTGKFLKESRVLMALVVRPSLVRLEGILKLISILRGHCDAVG